MCACVATMHGGRFERESLEVGGLTSLIKWKLETKTGIEHMFLCDNDYGVRERC